MQAAIRSLLASEFRSISSTYFNTAYFGPSPLRAKALAEAAVSRECDPSFSDYAEWTAISDHLREKLARLLPGASPDSIAHQTSVSESISQLANGLAFEAGDVVVAMQGDYPSDVLPWLLNENRRGYRVHLLPEDAFLDPARLMRELPERTRVVNLSHVLFNTGRRFDLAALGRVVRDRDALFVVDVTQSLGGLRIHPEELASIDVLACATYKWLLGPYGHAFSWYSDRALARVERTHASWLASPNSFLPGAFLQYTLETLPGARKFDRGQTPNMVPLALLAGGLDVLLEVGLEAIEEHDQALTRRFLTGLDRSRFEVLALGAPDLLSNIVVLRPRSGTADELMQRLKEQGVDVTLREGGLRISFHLFNTEEQVDRLLGTFSSKAT